MLLGQAIYPENKYFKKEKWKGRKKQKKKKEKQK